MTEQTKQRLTILKRQPIGVELDDDLREPLDVADLGQYLVAQWVNSTDPAADRYLIERVVARWSGQPAAVGVNSPGTRLQ
jgi:hypothetical protein